MFARFFVMGVIAMMVLPGAVSAQASAEDADGVGDNPGLRHLYGIGQRCERNGDFDMACNCYTEIVRLRPDSALADAAGAHCRRIRLQQVLQLLEKHTPQNSDDLEKLLESTIPLGMHYDDALLHRVRQVGWRTVAVLLPGWYHTGMFERAP